jgi:hypothetical protein
MLKWIALIFCATLSSTAQVAKPQTTTIYERLIGIGSLRIIPCPFGHRMEFFSQGKGIQITMKDKRTKLVFIVNATGMLTQAEMRQPGNWRNPWVVVKTNQVIPRKVTTFESVLNGWGTRTVFALPFSNKQSRNLQRIVNQIIQRYDLLSQVNQL